MSFRPPESDNDRDARPLTGPTDFHSLLHEGEAEGIPATPEKTDFHSLLNDPGATLGAQAPKPEATDFKSLEEQLPDDIKRTSSRGPTDILIDMLMPVAIFVLALSVILFLVDVRLIFTEEGYRNLYYVSVFFVLGIVAVNRLVAQEGATDSFLYVFGFGMVVFIYSAATMPEIRSGEGSVLGGWGPVFFNVLLAALVWWTTNRLVHECCVDENRTAGDIGILTGTADLLRKGVAQRQDKNFFEKNIEGSVFPDTDLAPYDPTQWQPSEFKGRHKVGMADKLSRRHPGISIIIFTAFVMAIFALGQRALVAGGPAMDLKGMMYVVTYTGVALILLMLSSLSGLREFFRNRYIVIPPGIGPFWVGLGTVMVGAVILGALAFPMPSNPPVPYIEHKFDPYSRTIILRQLETVQTSAAEQIMQNQIMFWSGRVVLIVLGLLCCYGFLRVVGFFAADIVANQHEYPESIGRIGKAIDRFLVWLLRIPTLPRYQRRPRINRSVATCARYRNPLGSGNATEMSAADHIAISYNALCALAYDLGVPRKAGQTPYEFLDNWPKILKPLREEAVDLTNLYVMTAYGPVELDDRVYDRLRKFWLHYEQFRKTVLH